MEDPDVAKMVMLQCAKVAVVLNYVESYSKHGSVAGTRKHDHEHLMFV